MYTKLTGLSGVLLLSAAMHGTGARAQTPTTIYNFVGGSDASWPEGELVLFKKILYGASYFTGTDLNGFGTVFEVNPSTGQESVIRAFKKGPGGYWPMSGLTLLGSNLYGITSSGGANRYGTVFRVSPHTGYYKVIYSPGQADGHNENGLISQGGLLYGATSDGGDGIIFQIDPATGLETVLHTFSGPDGAAPTGKLASFGGLLYGITGGGGANGQGTVYSFNPATRAATVLFNFTGSLILPTQGVIFANGYLYGTTDGYGSTSGTAFQLDPTTGAYTLLATFKDPPNATSLVSRMVYKGGKLYGTTSSDGTAGDGTIFSIDVATRKKSVLYNFTGGADGGSPANGLTDGGSVLYGATNGGGATGNGVVFSFKP